MNKNTKHNLCYIIFEILIGIMVLMVGIFIYGITNNTSLAIIVSSIVFCVCIPFLIIVIRLRPYKNLEQRKNKKNNTNSKQNDD